MSAPAIETVEQIVGDFTPMCTGKAHKGPATPARFGLDQHGCTSHLWCPACLAHERWVFREVKVRDLTATCNYCDAQLDSFDQAYPRVVPL